MRTRSTAAVARLCLATLVCLPLLVSLTATDLLARPDTRVRAEIPEHYKWNLGDIYPGWEAWEADLARLEALMDRYVALEGTLAGDPERLVEAFRLGDELGMLTDKVQSYAGLSYVTDLRDNAVAARQQQVQILFARFGTATAWFAPELLSIPWSTMESWLDATPGLAPYRFGVTDLYRQQQHVLTEDKEELLSYFSQLRASPPGIYSQLSTSDVEYPEITLSDGRSVTVTPGEYYSILTNTRDQADRTAAFEAFYGIYDAKLNTYAAIYDGVMQRDWAMARARNYASCVEAALDDDNVPVSVYENLVASVNAGLEPLHRYAALRKRILGLETYHTYDSQASLFDFEKSYEYDEVQDWVVESLAPLGTDYQQLVRRALAGGWLDVYENEGKADGAFSAGVYGVHPFMLLNFNDTLESVFTLAHELGHTIHTLLAHENQPYATADYTIFVAEVPSTLHEALLLDYLLERSDDPHERAALLVQAIDSIMGTFYTQSMFADFELRAHRMVEEGRPITADTLRELYTGLAKQQNGPAVVFDELYGGTWSRIGHFFEAPFYVYQYATCYASSAQLHREITGDDAAQRTDAVARFRALVESGGNDYPMEQLRKAGVDLTEVSTFQAVIDHLDQLVTRLETEIELL